MDVEVSIEALLGEVIDNELEDHASSYIPWLQSHSAASRVTETDWIINPFAGSSASSAINTIAGSSAPSAINPIAGSSALSAANDVTTDQINKGGDAGTNAGSSACSAANDVTTINASDDDAAIVEMDLVAVCAEEVQLTADDVTKEGQPAAKRRRKNGKQKDDYHFDIGRRHLMPRPLRLPLIMGAIISAFLVFAGVLGWSSEPLDCVEVFSGVSSIVKGFQEYGMASRGFDRDENVEEDIEKPNGMLLLMSLIRRVRPAGLTTWATPCSTWTIMNRGTSERSDHNPLGQIRHTSVAMANLVVSRMTVLMIWCSLLGLQWLLEQPCSSLMFQQPRFAEFLRSTTYYTIPTCMGAFGKSTLKGTTLLGSSRWMVNLHRTEAMIDPEVRQRMKAESRKVTSTTVDPTTGRKRFCGGPSLKSTQKYTKEYGLEIAKLFHENDEARAVNIDDDEKILELQQCDSTYDASDLWVDAQLEEVFCMARDRAFAARTSRCAQDQ